MSKSVATIDNYMNVTGNSTVVNVGSPFFTKQIRKAFTASSVNYEFDVPGSVDRDLEEFIALVKATAENGTTQTTTFALQGNTDPLESRTGIADATLAANATTINVTAASGAAIGSSTVAIPALLARFSTDGSPRRLVAYEWVMITSVSTDALTVTRGIYGTTAQAFTSADFLFYSNSWAPVKDSAGNNVVLTDLATDGATAAAPVVGQLALSQEGLTMLPFPVVRLRQAAPNSGGITYNADLTYRFR